MELSWSTFILEIINFLVLVWILKRFLYKPVQEIIARRRAGIEKTLAEAKSMRDEATSLQTQYEGRLADWDKERQQAREDLANDLELERSRKLTELQTTLQQEQEKIRVAESQRLHAARQEMEKTALAQGGRFASRLLKQAASVETETRLLELVIDELACLPAERITTLHNSWSTAPQQITVRSAFPITDDLRQRLEQAVLTVSALRLPVQFEQVPELIAGVELTIGSWVLGANLRDELKGFMELPHEDKTG